MIRRFRVWAMLLPVVLLAACGGTSSTAAPTAARTTAATAGTTSLTSTAAAASTSAATAPASTPSSLSAATSAGATPVQPGSASSNVTLTLDPNQSQALYKARETLASIGSPTEAVGKTSQLSGTIVFTSAGKIDSSASKITIDLSTLQSDQSQRDNYIKRNTLDTNQYPNAVFVPTSIQGLTWPLPTSGQANLKIVGNLTVHGQTAQTTWDATVTFAPQEVQGTATTTVKFEQFGMSPPKTFLVLSVQDDLTLEMDFVFKPGS